MKLASPLFFLLILQLSNVAHAADIVRDVSAGRSNEFENGGYFELGFSAGYLDQSALHVETRQENGFFIGGAIGGAYRYKQWFIEAAQGTFDGLSTGYTLYSGDRFNVDFLFTSINGTIDTDLPESEDIVNAGNDDDKNDYLLKRDTLYSGTGLRLTAYHDQYVLQWRVLSDIYDSAGLTTTLRLGRSWLIKNWNFHAIMGLEYASATTHNYLYGVEEDFATERFSAYEADAGVSFSGEIGVSYPVSENWVYRSFIRVRHLSDQIANSPLTTGDTDSVFYHSISYVF